MNPAVAAKIAVMDLKKLANVVSMLLTRPAMAWKSVTHSGDRTAMLNGFLYPLIMLSCLSSFLGMLFGYGIGFENIYYVIIKTGVLFATLFLSYHLLAFIVSKFTTAYMKAEYDRLLTDHLAGYSMVVILLLEICLGLFPNFRIIGWILQFYTVKIVWDGAAVLMRVPEERRLSYVIPVSLSVIFVPVAVGSLMSMLSVNFG